jgi:hypothetical protein
MQYATLALLGVTSAAVTPSPLPTTTNYPVRSVAPVTSATEVDATSGDILEPFTYSSGTNKAGLYRGFRAGYYAFPTQTLTKPVVGTATSVAAVVTSATTTRTFWQLASNQNGSWPATSNGLADGTNADGSIQTVCPNANMTSRKCNGGLSISFHADANTTAFPIPNRLFAKGGVTSSVNIGTKASSSVAITLVAAGPYVWNEDLLMSSFYHPAATTATATTDGTSWCTMFKNSLSITATTDTVLTASNGLNGKSKCTWLL